MKKILLLMAIVAVCFGANAQSKFGVKGGINFSSMTFKNNGVGLDTKMILGIHIGVLMERQFNNGFYLQPGLLLSTKGTKWDFNDNDFEYNTTYLELPVNLGYKVELNGAKLLLAGGPYFAYGISGEVKSGGKTADIEWGSGKDKDLKPFEAGLNLSTGVEVQKFQFTLQYGVGFNNIANEEGTIKNKVFGISAAYIF
jgi:hypothetical protein